MFKKCILVLASFFSLAAWSRAPWKLDIELVKPLYFSFDLNSTASLSIGRCQLKIVDTYWGAPSCYSSAGIAYNGMTHLYKGAPGTTAELPYAIDSEDHYSPVLDHTPMAPRLNGNESIITNCDANSLISTGYFREAKPAIVIPTDSNGNLKLPMPTEKMMQLLINKVVPQTARCVEIVKDPDLEDLKMPGFKISDDPSSSEASDLAGAVSRSNL